MTTGLVASPPPRQQAAVRTVSRTLIAIAFGLSGAAALIYEVTWTRELSLVLGSTVYAVSIMLATFMSGLAIGSASGGKWADRSVDRVALFAKLEFGVGVLGLLSIPAMRLLPSVYLLLTSTFDPHFWLYLTMQAMLSFAIMIGPTTLMGATFPVVMSATFTDAQRVGSSVGSVYSLNTIGAVVGAIAGGFLLNPLVGIRGAVFVAAGLNLLVSLAIMWRTQNKGLWKWSLAALVCIALAVIGSLAYPTPGYAAATALMGRAETYGEIQRLENSTSVVFSQECPYGEVQVRGGSDGELLLVHGASIEGSNRGGDPQTNRLLALVPSMTAVGEESALVIGLGTGYTTQAMLSLPYERVETIEISPAVVEASEYFVGESLGDDPRWELVVDDARSHLFLSEETYDVITSEPSWPLSDSVAHLFTLEFFEIARNHLGDDGVLCQWFPIYLLEREDFMMVYKTFSEVFPDNYVWVVDGTSGRPSDLFIVGVKSGEHVDSALVRARTSYALERMDPGSRPSFHLFESTETMAQSLTDPSVPLNTDEHSLLEYRVLENVVESNADH